MKMNKGLTLVLCLLVAALFVAPAFAQETTAGLQGSIKDASGAVVSGATVEVTSPAMLGVKKVETDASGYYRFANLPLGTYTITVSAKNFKTVKQGNISLNAGSLPTVDLKLEVGGVEQVVEVSSAAPIVDVSTSKVQSNISEDILSAIPKGRSFESVIPFAPGARQEPLSSANRGSGGFQIDGASDSENTYMSEGMDTTGIAGGGSGNHVPMEFVQEVQIKSGGFEAEFGGALGGVVNVVQKRGGNSWHGSAFTYFRGDALNANDACVNYVACGLRYIPGTAAGNRLDKPVEYYMPKKDHKRWLEPGFEAGGYLMKDRLWLFTSFVPEFYSRTRTVMFHPTDPKGAGQYTFRTTQNTYNALNRMDWLVTNKIRTFASWQYGYVRQSGNSVPEADSAYNQFNNSSANDPRTAYRQDAGAVFPNSIVVFGGDVTITPNLIGTARYGKWFTNSATRGTPQGIRYIWDANGTVVNDATGAPLPGNFGPSSTAGSFNIPNNVAQTKDAYHRDSFSGDLAYFKKFFGTHNFKFGYANNRITNDVFSGAVTARVDMYPGQAYSPNGGVCPVAAQKLDANGAVVCRGTYGYYVISDYEVGGMAKSMNHALYFQDAWTVGKGVTINAGVRMDKEYLPPYTQGATDISFGFGDKIAPRIGGAWDVMQNGKLKIYGSYGMFYDIMKYSLPRGSFGGDYWHDCAYTLDTNVGMPDAIQPATQGGHTCAGSGDAYGVHPGTLIENFDFRKTSLQSSDPGVDPNIKPMSQYEMTFGADYALTPQWGLETRYTRKRLIRTIEDIGIVVPGGEVYKIGNPGEDAYAQLLQRQIEDSGTVYAAQCTDCNLSPKAIRNYDGLEIRLVKRPTGKWFGTVSYTYSRLYGNYSGLASTDVNDAASANAGAGGGRQNPNNNRSFDSPNMQFTAYGKPALGPLGTDRPNTFKAFGYYRLKWFHQETLLGLTQLVYQGTPQTTCWPAVTTQSACSFVENRGNWVNLHRDATTGYIVSDGVTKSRRSPLFSQTDLSVVHELKLSKTNERLALSFEGNVSNLFNQRTWLSLMNTPLAPGQHAEPMNGGSPDWKQLTTTGWDYIGVSNAAGKYLNNMYGKPNLFQAGRTIRLKIGFNF